MNASAAGAALFVAPDLFRFRIDHERGARARVSLTHSKNRSPLLFDCFLPSLSRSTEVGRMPTQHGLGHLLTCGPCSPTSPYLPLLPILSRSTPLSPIQRDHHSYIHTDAQLMFFFYVCFSAERFMTLSLRISCRS